MSELCDQSKKMAYRSIGEEGLECVQLLAELVEPDRLLLRDVRLVLDLLEHAQEDVVDERAESRVQCRRVHDGLNTFVSSWFLDVKQQWNSPSRPAPVARACA